MTGFDEIFKNIQAEAREFVSYKDTRVPFVIDYPFDSDQTDLFINTSCRTLKKASLQ